MYVKGKISNPQITKIVKINSNESWELSFVKEEILHNEYKGNRYPFSVVDSYFKEGILIIDKARDYCSYREYEKRNAKERDSTNSYVNSGTKQDRRGSNRENTRIDSADSLSESAFSFDLSTQRKSYDTENAGVEKYTEQQYNNFGWVRYNNVLSAKEYSALLSRYADYKYNKNKYPTTRFGEAVIFSFDYPDVLMYVKGSIVNPQISKIIRITEDNAELLKQIREELLSYEYQQVPLPYQNVKFIFGEKILDTNKRQDFISFQGYKRIRERELGKENSIRDRGKRYGKGSIGKNTSVDVADSLSESAFSLKARNDSLGQYSLGSPIQDMRYNPETYAKELKSRYDSKIDDEAIINKLKQISDQENKSQEETLQEVFDANGDYVGEILQKERLINELAVQIAEGIEAPKDEYAQEVMALVTEDYLYVNKKQRTSIRRMYGNITNYYNAVGVYLRTSDDPLADEDVVSLDDAWEYWADWYPELFNNIISSDDMPARLAEVVEYLNTLTDDIDYDEIASNIAEELYAKLDDIEAYNQNKDVNEEYRLCYAETYREIFNGTSKNIEEDEDNLISEFLVESNKKYTKLQYDSFGWALYNEVLNAEELKYLLEEYSKYMEDSELFVTTKFGEVVVHSQKCPDVLLYVMGSANSPRITKVVKLENEYADEIKEEILFAEDDQDLFALTSAQNEADGIIVFKANDEITYWEYLRQLAKKAHTKKDIIIQKAKDAALGTSKVAKKEEKQSDEKFDDSEHRIWHCFVKCTDTERILAAENMEKEGKGNSEIWRKLKITRSIFGDWVGMIGADRIAIYVDGGSRSKGYKPPDNLINANGNMQGQLADFVGWSDLYRKYPEFKDVQVSVVKSSYDSDTVKFLPQEQKIVINKKYFDEYRKNHNHILKAHLLREIQRMIQFKEGKYVGKNYEYWKQLELEEKLPFIENLERRLTADEMMKYFIDNYEADLVAQQYELSLLFNRQVKEKKKIPLNTILILEPLIDPDKAIMFDQDENLITVRENDNKSGKNIFANFSINGFRKEFTEDVDDELNEQDENVSYFGEKIENTPKRLKPVSNQEWREFCIDFADKTNEMRDTDKKQIVVNTSVSEYLVDATGYIKGTILKKKKINTDTQNDVFDNEGAFFMPKNNKKSQEDIGDFGETTLSVKNFVSNLQKNRANKQLVRQDKNIKGGNSGFVKDINEILSITKSDGQNTALYDEFKRRLYIRQLIPIAPNDTIGRKIDKTILSNIEDTAFKNDKGEPISVYVINNYDRYMFNYAQIGVAVGTIDMAVSKHNDYKKKQRRKFKGQCEEYYLNVKKPLILPFEPYELSVHEIGFWLAEEFIISNDEYFDLIDDISSVAKPTYKSIAFRKIRRRLQEKGYDSIAFINQQYDPGSLSVVVFDEEKLVPVAKNGVLINDNGIADTSYDIEESQRNFIGNNVSFIKQCLQDAKFLQRKYRKKADERITAGSSDWFESYNQTSQDNAYNKILKNISEKSELEYNEYASDLNRKFDETVINKMNETVFKTDDGDFVSFYFWSKKERSVRDVVRQGMELKSFNCAFKDFIAAKTKSKFSYNGIFCEYIVNSVNPLVLKLNGWNTAEITDYLYQNGKITQKFYDEITSHSHYNNPKYTNHAAKKVRAKIEMLGYDSIIFVKETGDVSLLPIDEKQLLPIAVNGILLDDNGINLDRDEFDNYVIGDNDIEYVVLDREDRSYRDIQKMNKTILSMQDNTDKLIWLTEYLACTNNPDIKNETNVSVGHSGMFEIKSSNVWAAQSLLERAINSTSSENVAQYDTAEEKINNSIMHKFKNSAFKDNGQRLLSFFVWNKYGDNRNEHSAFPYVVGTARFARDGYLAEKEKHPNLRKGVFEEYYLNAAADQIYFMRSSPGEISAKTIADDMYENGLLSKSEYRIITSREGSNWTHKDNNAAKHLRRVLKQKGIKAIAYLNRRQGKGLISIIVPNERDLFLVSENGKRISNNVEKRQNKIIDNSRQYDIIKNKDDRPKLTDDEKYWLKQQTGWSDEIIAYISSLEEAQIYIEAGLKEAEIDGVKCLIKSNIDMNQLDDQGRTNRERMAIGRPPLMPNGEIVELHHIGQRPDSPLAELTVSEHRKNGNYKILHNLKNRSRIDRKKFKKPRKMHWKTRAKLEGDD